MNPTGAAGGWGQGDVFLEVAAAGLHTCALKFEGFAVCWGYRGPTALGDGRLQVKKIDQFLTAVKSSVKSGRSAGAAAGPPPWPDRQTLVRAHARGTGDEVEHGVQRPPAALLHPLRPPRPPAPARTPAAAAAAPRPSLQGR